MPLLSNGKVNRKALPAPVAERSGGDFIPPANATEMALAAIWEEVLGSPGIGLTDNFFELGGHSLSATRVVSRIRSVLGVELPLRAIFEAPTLAQLSASVAQLRHSGTASAVKRNEAVRVQRGTPFPVSFSQRRMWLLQVLDPSTTAYNLPLTLRLRGELDRDALLAALQLLGERIESFRTTIVMRARSRSRSSVERRHSNWRSWTFRNCPWNRRRPGPGSCWVSVPVLFDLACGPLHRFCLVAIRPDDHLLMILMHHAVSDDWSFGILLRELRAAYRAMRHGIPVNLPPITIQPADHAAWQRKRFGASELDEQYLYWGETWGTTELALPTDRPLPILPRLAGIANGSADLRGDDPGSQEGQCPIWGNALHDIAGLLPDSPGEIL